MLTKQYWKKLSQATATTVLGVAIVAGFGMSRASAVNLQQFKISGTFGDKNYGFGGGTHNLENGSFDGTYTVDVDQLPNRFLKFEEWSITIRDSSGTPKDGFSSSYNGSLSLPYPYNYSASLRPVYADILELDFDYAGPSPSTVRELLLYVDSDFTGTSTGRLYGVENGVPIYGFYSQRAPSNTFRVISFKSEPVPEPLTLGGTAVAGAMGLWLKRKKQTSCQAV